MRRLNVFLTLCLVAFSLWGYTQLPAIIPVHFDAHGNVNGTGSRATFLIMPLIGIFTIGFLMAIVELTIRNPKYVNMPDKKRFMTLSADEQKWVLEPLGESMEWLSTLLILLFWVIQLSMYMAATGRDVGWLLGVSLVVFVPSMMVFPIIMLVRMQKRINEALKRAKAPAGVVMR